MAANPTPTSDPVLLARCQSLLAGCLALEGEVGLKQNTAAKLQADMLAVTTALTEVGRCKAERGKRRKEFRERDREGEIVLGRCRLRLLAIFGPGFNAQWETAGFPDRSTMVPEVFAKRLTLLDQLQNYFVVRPEHESLDMQATAGTCAGMHRALSQARSAVDHAGAMLRGAVLAKDKALLQLRKRMRGLIRELDLLMARDDSRWKRFGLNMPAGGTAPEPVTGVKAEALGQGRVQVEWPAAAHATRYRMQVREMGRADFVSVATVHDPQCTLDGQEQGSFIEIQVISANKQDEAAASPAVSVAVR